MSTALVANATMATTATRIANARGSVASTYQSVDAIDTDSLAARRRDYDNTREDQDLIDSTRPRRRSGGYEAISTFGGVMVSREVGTAIVQAQAALGGQPEATTPFEAERHISVYEFNQSLMGPPQVTTDVGVMH